jgi:undecaprenyl-diphosphatase
MDGSLFESINRFAARTGWAHGFMRFYTNNGIVLFAVLLLFGYLLARHRSDVGGVASSLWAGAAAIVALGFGQIIGNLVHRARPYETLANVHLLVDKTTDFSFPSDHATVVGAVAVGLFFVDRWLGLAAASAALLMAFTRVYVGAHYPGDVVAGLALGGTVAALGQIAVVPIIRRALDHLSISRFRWLVVSRDRISGSAAA